MNSIIAFLRLQMEQGNQLYTYAVKELSAGLTVQFEILVPNGEFDQPKFVTYRDIPVGKDFFVESIRAFGMVEVDRIFDRF